jgi:hypothetical protein
MRRTPHPTRTPICAAALALAALACDVGPSKLPDMALHADGLDSPRSVAPQPGLGFDPSQSADGRGSFRIEARGERTAIELADVAIEAPELPRISYRAKLRAENVAGRAYLELWVKTSDGREHVAQALHSQITGSSEWSTHDASLILSEGVSPTRARLSVVVEGRGTVWVDAITLRAGRD